MSTIGTIQSNAPTHAPQAITGGRIQVVVTYLAEKLIAMMDKRRSRLVLMSLTDDQLKDIGVSRADAFREGIRPFWD